MKYRYFYNAQQAVIAETCYKSVCFVEGAGNSVGYVDLDHRVNINSVVYDLTSQTLIAKVN